MTETKTMTRRQLVEKALEAAMNGEWEAAIEINKEIIEKFPQRDAAVHNRLGRAYMQSHRLTDAHDAYSAALKIDPANMIARRNLQKLDLIRQGANGADVAQIDPLVVPRAAVFIEEVGKTWVDELINPEPMTTLATISSGEQLALDLVDGKLVISNSHGQRLGEVEAKTAERVIALMNGGNRYEVYALGLAAASLRIILRETYRDPANAGKVSFPRQISQTRAYLRERDLLRQRDEADLMMIDEEEMEVEDEDTSPLSVEEEDTHESDHFGEEEPVVLDDEEPRI